MSKKRQELNEKAAAILADRVARLSRLPYAEIATWPEWPKTPDVDLEIPPELSEYKFGLMKENRPDGCIRVAIQLYRHIFLGIGTMGADGFNILNDGTISRLSEKDLWDVT